VSLRAFVVAAADGAEIVCTAHEPAGPPRSTIVVAPSGPVPRAGPFRSMTRLAHLLCRAGHRVVRADLRGFGEAGADVSGGTIHDHTRAIERGLHVDDLLAVLAVLEEDAPLVLFGGCGGAATVVRAAERDPRVRAVIAYALPVVLTGGRAAQVTGRSGPSRGLALAQLGLGETILRGSLGRIMPRGLAPWLNVALIRALRGLAGKRPVLLLFGDEDDVRGHLARYRLDRLPGVEIDELPGMGHDFDDPADVERVAEVMQAWLRRQELGRETAVASHA
jgi:pimeloyl-ACP methyl ester carboxylesterase